MRAVISRPARLTSCHENHHRELFALGPALMFGFKKLEGAIASCICRFGLSQSLSDMYCSTSAVQILWHSQRLKSIYGSSQHE